MGHEKGNGSQRWARSEKGLRVLQDWESGPPKPRYRSPPEQGTHLEKRPRLKRRAWNGPHLVVAGEVGPLKVKQT